KQMIRAFCEGREKAGHAFDELDICRMNVHGCLACEYCHRKGNGQCVQKDDMGKVYQLLGEVDMLVIASPIYYHGLTGQLKCCIDRFYAALYPKKAMKLSKISMLLVSGDADMYDGAMFSYGRQCLYRLNLQIAQLRTGLLSVSYEPDSRPAALFIGNLVE
ncbi:MAG: flavodoxin family protein, partial [Oscillospiraceae bacterium]|nr:flavodoxin family protein [Oscillospiraceae bacterium]